MTSRGIGEQEVSDRMTGCAVPVWRQRLDASDLV